MDRIFNTTSNAYKTVCLNLQCNHILLSDVQLATVLWPW